MDPSECLVGLVVKLYDGHRVTITDIKNLNLSTDNQVTIQYDDGSFSKAYCDELSLIDPLLEIEYQAILSKIKESSDALNEAANFAKKQGTTIRSLLRGRDMPVESIEQIAGNLGWSTSSFQC